MNAYDLLEGVNQVDLDLVYRTEPVGHMGRSVKTNLWRSFAANRQIAGAVLTAILLFAIILTVTFSKGHGQSEVRVPDQNNDLVSVLSGMDSDEWYEKRAELQKNALAANAALTSSFERDGLGNYIWPDSFCGAWIEEEYLVIALKSLDTDVKQGYEKVLTEYTAYVKYVERKYSKNELYALIDKVSEEIKNQYGESIQSYSLLEQENRIEIGVSQELLTKIREDGYEKKYDSVIRFTTSGIVNICATLKGGMAISNSNANCGMTLSACGYFGGSNAIVTCGHGGQSWLDPIKYSGSLIGYIESKQYSDYGYGDYSIVTATTGNHTISSMILAYTVTGWYNSLPVNAVVKFYGYATGSTGWGEVKDTGAMVYTNDYIHVRGMHKVEIHTGSVTNGDSGGPFFVTNGSSNVSYCGVLCGDYVTEESQWIVVFTPCQYLTGFTVNYVH